MKASNLKVKSCLDQAGFGVGRNTDGPNTDDPDTGMEIVILPEAVRTAKLAADALACEVGQIANSLIFRNSVDNSAVLVMCSGDRRVDLQKVEALTGIRLTRADADFVRQETGFAIGGVPPVAHRTRLRCLLDQSLQRFTLVWAAAGTPESVFSMTPEQLQAMTAGDWFDIAQD